MNQLERITGDGEVIQSPWTTTASGCPVFISDAYEEHVQEWINKEQEGKKILWELGAIADSLVGRCQGSKGDKALGEFAATVGVSKRRIYQLAETHGFRVELENECCTRVQHLPETLTLKHYFVVLELVYKQGGSLA